MILVKTEHGEDLWINAMMVKSMIAGTTPGTLDINMADGDCITVRGDGSTACMMLNERMKEVFGH